MKAIYTVLLFVLVISLYSCFSKRTPCPSNWTPPGTVRVSENFYYDQTEISNISWKEYQSWMLHAYGENSKEYLATIPDTSVWFSQDTALSSLLIRHPAFYEYPIVGITQEQAILYSKWRTDVVFALIILRLGILDEPYIIPSKDLCTVERYFMDSCDCVPGSYKITGYWKYELPRPEDFREAVLYSDSCHINKLSKCWKKECKECLMNYPDIICKDDYMTDSSKNIMVPVKSGCVPYKKQVIWNLRGNVGEWSSIEGVSLGGSWFDYYDEILVKDTFHVVETNKWTGFRNVCHWHEWEDE